MVISIENSHTWIEIRPVKYDWLAAPRLICVIKLSHSRPSVHAFAAPIAKPPQSLAKISSKRPQYKKFYLHNSSCWMETHPLIWHQASGGKVMKYSSRLGDIDNAREVVTSTHSFWLHHLNLGQLCRFCCAGKRAIMRSDLGGSRDTWACHIRSGWIVKEYHRCISRLHTRKCTAGTPWNPTMKVWKLILSYFGFARCCFSSSKFYFQGSGALKSIYFQMNSNILEWHAKR